MRHYALALLAACCITLPANAQSLADMRVRDRFAPPAQELAAWKSFAEPVLADPATPKLARAETHLGLAIAHFYAKQFDAGWMQVERAEAELGQSSASFRSELSAYASLLLTELGRPDDAEPYAARAMAEAQDEAQAALAHNASAALAFARNDLPRAESDFCRARDLSLAAAQPDHPMIVTNASSCGVVKYFLERDDTLAAIRWARDHAFAHLPPDHPRMGNVLNTSYAVLVRFGRYSEAEPLVRRHLDLERALHTGPADDVYDPLSMLGRVLGARGALEDAEGILRAAADMAGQLEMGGQPYAPGIARSNLARIIARQGRMAEAEAEARAALAVLQQDVAADDWHIGSVQVLLADLVATRARPEEALVLVDTGLASLTAKLPPEHSEVLSARLVRARILALLGRTEEALPLARAAAMQFEGRMLDLTASEQEQVELSGILPLAFGHYLETAMASNATEDVVRAGQLHLLSELAVTNARMAAGAIARSEGLGGSYARLEAARVDLARRESDLARAESQGDADLVALQTEAAMADHVVKTASEELLARFPEFARLARPQVPSLQGLQSRQGPDDMLVMPIALADRAVTLVVTREEVRWADSAGGENELGQLTRRLRRAVSGNATFDVDAAHALYRKLFPAELAPLLASKSRLLFPASGYLAQVPPGLLLRMPASKAALAQAEWLVRTHSVEIVADLALAAPAGGALTARGFLGVGAPQRNPPALGDYRLPPLPRARSELELLGRALSAPRQVILAEAEATEARLGREQLAEFGVIAFATHGLVGGEVPGLAEPALLMNADGENGDGLLTASEIAALPLSADWVILSACETAAGDNAGAPTYSGLARAFVAAGAKSLMLSHWRVRDDAAAFLSVETVRRAASGLPRAEAMRQAQLALMSSAEIPDAAHPANWAPFVILEN